jgi:hypothetical protein
MAAIQLVHVYVADQIVVAFDQRGVRLGFVDGIVTVEHGADGGVIDLAHQRGGFVERSDHIALAERQRFHQNRHAALAGVRGDGGQAIDEVPGSIRAAESAGGTALLGRAEDQDAVRAEIGAEIDEMADVLPAPAAEVGIGRGDMQSLGADHEPVQADELQAFGGDDVAAFAAARGRERGRISASVNGAISMPLYPALRMARHASAKAQFSKTSLQMAWRRRCGMQMPVRSTIHSLLVSTIRSISLLVRTSGGT